MSQQRRYLVTTNAVTGEIESVEQIGSAGELITVDPSTLLGASVATGRELSQAAGAEVSPGVFVSPELPDLRSEASEPGVFLGSELPEGGVREAAPGVFVSPELPEVRSDDAGGAGAGAG